MTAIILVALVLRWALFQKETPEQEKADATTALAQYLHINLSTEWQLVDEIILRFQDDIQVVDYFTKYPMEDLAERRKFFLFLCLHAIPSLAESEGAFLSKEFTEAIGLRIKSLPEPMRAFYETKISIRDINPPETIILLDETRGVLLTESEETKRNRQESLLSWSSINFSEDEHEKHNEINLLMHCFGSQEVIFRFKRKPRGIKRKQKWGWSGAFKPAFSV